MKKLILLSILFCNILVYATSQSSNYRIKKYTELDYSKQCIHLASTYNKDYTYVREIYLLVHKYCEIYQLPEELVISLACIESNLKQYAKSYKGAEYGRGLCQISEVLLKDYNNKNYFKEYYKPNDLYNLEVNIKIACWYINRLKYVYHLNNFDIVLSAYNRGPNSKGYSRRYVNRINDLYGELKGL